MCDNNNECLRLLTRITIHVGIPYMYNIVTCYNAY